MEGLGSSTLANLTEQERLRIYVLITVILIVIAAAVSLLSSYRQTGVGGCLGILLASSRYSCLSSLALTTKNASICSKISGEGSSSCYDNVAQAGLNATACTMIPNENQTYSCELYIANATHSSGPCNYLSGKFQAYCKEYVATRFSEISACSGLNASESPVCSSAVDFSIAQNLGNQSYCSHVSNTSNTNLTTRIVNLVLQDGKQKVSNGIFSVNPIYYLEYSNTTFKADDLCYYSVAISDGNSGACEGISNSTLMSDCVSSVSSSSSQNSTSAEIANITRNVSGLYSLCTSASIQQNSSSCTSFVDITEAVLTKNASYCSKITVPESKYQCYSSMASAYENISYCGYIPNATANSACIQAINFSVTK